MLPVFWCACSPLNVHLTQAQSENQIRLFSAKISLKVIIYIMQEACGCIVCRRNSLKALRRLFIITVLHCWFVFYTLSHQSDFPGCLVHQLGLNKESSWVSLLDIWHLISLRGGLELKKKNNSFVQRKSNALRERSGLLWKTLLWPQWVNSVSPSLIFIQILSRCNREYIEAIRRLGRCTLQLAFKIIKQDAFSKCWICDQRVEWGSLNQIPT